MARFLAALCLLVALHPAARADDKFFLHDGQRVVFLGDSNTHAGRFITYLDAYLATRFPDQKFELINLGLPSETVSGLSEPDHPYPRPDVHERLERALEKTKPDVVVAGYGMNDGIYYPFSEERFHKYQQGMERLIERVQKAGAKVVLLTPAPFDPQPVKDKLLPPSADRFSWLHPYEGYDGVLTRNAEWLLSLRDKGLVVADAHDAINRYLAAMRRSDPKYHVSADGIHPDATGHWLLARALLLAWNAPPEVDGAEIDAQKPAVVRGQVSDLVSEKGVLRFTWLTRLPMPADPQWDRGLAQQELGAERLNQHRLVVRGAGHERYELFEGDRKLGTVSREQLAAGLDLLPYKDLSTNSRAAELGKRIEQRQQLLAPAWLTEVGHKRPDTPKGLPLDEARRRAAPIEADICKLAQPVKLTLRLVPAE